MLLCYFQTLCRFGSTLSTLIGWHCPAFCLVTGMHLHAIEPTTESAEWLLGYWLNFKPHIMLHLLRRHKHLHDLFLLLMQDSLAVIG